jgi:HEAT repeats
MWRFGRQLDVRSLLPGLCHDPDVALHAMSALRRAVGNARALPTLVQIAATHPDPHVRDNATRAVRKARQALAASKGS